MTWRTVTITVERETDESARIEASRRDTTISRLVGSLLREPVESDRDFESAKRQFLSGEPGPLGRTGDYPDRDEIRVRNGA